MLIYIKTFIKMKISKNFKHLIKKILNQDLKIKLQVR